MTPSAPLSGLEKNIQRSSILVGVGLVIQLLSLIPLHALAFIAFTGLGVPLVAAGILLFLWTLVSQK